MDKIIVTQADADSASLFLYALDYDQFTDLQQAFARHRIESQRPLLEALENIMPYMQTGHGVPNRLGASLAASAALAAIKQAKGE